jgi:molybdenum cofactor cytidylyltransferase
MSDPAIAGLILSGGASLRMGSPKALLEIDGETFLDRLIALLSRECAPVIVVLGFGAERIRSGVERGDEAVFAMNPHPERGMLSSLQCGLRALPDGLDAVLFTPVDLPNVQSSTITALAQGFREHAAPVTIPMHARRHGHPVCVAQSVIDELLAAAPESQARDVLKLHRNHTRYVEVHDPGILLDIDDREAYLALTGVKAPA